MEFVIVVVAINIRNSVLLFLRSPSGCYVYVTLLHDVQVSENTRFNGVCRTYVRM